MCTLLQVSAAGYYEWRDRAISHRATSDAELAGKIVGMHEFSRRTYGSPRVHAALREHGERIGHKRVARLMRSYGLRGRMKRAFRHTTDSNHNNPVAPNLLNRQFQVEHVDTHYAGDITYIPTREGFLYLAIVLDLASRMVVGWSMKTRMSSDIVLDALSSAIQRRKPKGRVLFHSDRGTQYTSDKFREAIERFNMISSMSGKGQCWDNAVVESFFGTMKRELGDPIWETRAIARAAIFEYIEVWYNRQRLHSTLNYLSPEHYERTLAQAA
jgi:transposase InsO family protein